MHRSIDSNYYIRIQSGIIIVILLLIGLFKMEWKPGDRSVFIPPDGDPIEVPQIDVTVHHHKPAPPPRPQVRADIPDSDIPDDPPLFISEWYGYDLPINEPALAGDDDHNEDPLEWSMVEYQPQMIGGAAELYSRITYPEPAIISRTEGRVVIEFIVSRDGSVKDAVILRGIGAGADEEALRALKTMKFTPGVQSGRLVEVRMRQSIQFRLR